MTTAIN